MWHAQAQCRAAPAQRTHLLGVELRRFRKQGQQLPVRGPQLVLVQALGWPGVPHCSTPARHRHTATPRAARMDRMAASTPRPHWQAGPAPLTGTHLAHGKAHLASSASRS